MNQPQRAYFFQNGHVSIYDETGQPMYELQAKGWMQVYFDYLEQQGYDPTAIVFRAKINNDEFIKISPFKTEHGWNINIDIKQT